MEWRSVKDHWPHSDQSRFVSLGRKGRWHLQEMGQDQKGRGTLCLIHGAGGATQSWRGLMPLLAAHRHVVAMDLPGQGFTIPDRPGRYGLDPMARDLLELITDQGWQPTALIGHSAGAALALRMTDLAPDRNWQVIGLNAALEPFDGVAGWVFPIAAKAMALNPLTAPFLAATARRSTVVRILDGTGSRLGDDGIALYTQLFKSTRHVDGTLRMMANWSLDPLLTRLPKITAPVHLIVGEQDGTVPPEVSTKAAARLPNARLTRLPGLGHLAHEDAPERVAQAILDNLREGS